ncbi:MAG: fimbrillin family protein, partial [Lachnospiraceae bacterium]|nr:fimbrillin family protein [Lachnospiraceae bacterium]
VMKKVIFISALAIAAAVSCNKSEIVDTKFNEQISFETYTGRDAMTKATPYGQEALPADMGLYGFYTGASPWSETIEPNLWDNAQVTQASGWAPSEKKYWTNEEDKYTFLAYAPYATGAEGNGLVAVTGADPKVTYTVPTAIAPQVDLLYANTPAAEGGHIDMVKPSNNTVALNFAHALSRITVKASEAESAYNYTVYGLELSGNFVKTKTFDIEDGEWIVDETNYPTTPEAAPYVIKQYTEGANDGVLVPDTRTGAVEEGQTPNTPYDFAGANNYLMVIPVDFTGEETTTNEAGETVNTYPNAATLKVTYTTTFADFESKPMIKTVAVPTNFEQGKAYSLNLVFAPNTTNEIKFSVTVDNWTEEAGVVYPNNPENGTPEGE